MLPARSSDHTGDKGHFRLIYGYLLVAGGIIGVAVLFLLVNRCTIGIPGLLLGLLLIPIILYGIAKLVHAGIGTGSEGFTRMVLASGNLAPAPTFSAEEALVLKGKVEEARAMLEARLAENPDDIAVRLHLTALVRDHQRDYVTAERLCLDARAAATPMGPAHQDAVANALIDLYERTGNRGRLMAEYARFAARHPGTKAGEAAKRRLQEMKAEA